MLVAEEQFRGLATFVSTARMASFSGAARELGVTTSAVSKGIVRLETRLGVRLFDRTTRVLTLTDDGQALFDRCAVALQELVGVQAALSVPEVPSGRVRVQLPAGFGRNGLLTGLLRQRAANTSLSLEVCLHRGKSTAPFDIAVLAGVPDHDPDLVVRRLHLQQTCLVAAPSYLQVAGMPAHPQQLLAHECITYTMGEETAYWWLQQDGTPAKHFVPSRLKLDCINAVMDAAVGGFGLAQLPCWMIAAHLEAGRLKRVLDAWMPPATPLYLVWPRRLHLNAGVRLVANVLLRHFGAADDT